MREDGCRGAPCRLQPQGGCDRVDAIGLDLGVGRRAVERQVLVEEVRREAGVAKGRVLEDLDQEGAVRAHAADARGAERAREPLGRLGARRRVGDHLGEHRIVVDRHRRAGLDAALPAHALAVRLVEGDERARRRQEVVARVLGVQADLDRVTVRREIVLPERQRSALRDLELEADEVETGDRLGHRVLDLEARVHLEEVEVALRVDDELDGAGALVADRATGGDGRVAEPGTERGVDGGRRRLLDDLLVAALDRALALEAVHQVAVRVAEDLDLDVAGRGHVALDEQRVVAEGARRLAPGGRERVGQRRRLADDAHALAAAARRRLHQHGEADLGGARGDGRRVEAGGREAGDHGDARRLHDRLRLDLAAHAADRVFGRGR